MGSKESVPMNHLQKLSAGRDDDDILQSGLCNADPVTKQGRRIQLFQMLMIPLLPLAFLVVECSVSLSNTLKQVTVDGRVRDQVDSMMDLATLLDSVQRERTQALHYLTTGRAHPQQYVTTTQYTDTTLRGLDNWPVKEGSSDRTSLIFNKMTFKISMRTIREIVLKNESETHPEDDYRDLLFHTTLEFYNKLDEQLYGTFVLKLRNVTGKVWKHLIALKSVLQLRESFDIEMVLAEFYFVHGYMVDGHYRAFLKHYALGKDAAIILRRYSDTAKLAFSNFEKDHADIHEYITDKQKMVLELTLDGQKKPEVAAEWIHATEEYEKLTIDLWHKLEEESRQDLADSRTKSISDESIAIVMICFVICLSPAILSSTWRLTSKIQSYARDLARNSRERRREKKRSDMLLYQMLPKSVALQLKLSKRVAAESYNSVSIYFSDIVGFTSLGSKSTPMQVVDFLNKLYYFFDGILSKFDVYKVETIGDAYMVTSGVPQRNGKRHAGEVSCMALEIVDGLRTFQVPHMPQEQIQIRIGIHTGAVVAGVVGTKMPRYCLFGETVSLASCMESSGIPMQIQLSAATKDALDDLGGYSVERRGQVHIKGTGYETWLLIGRQTSRVTSNASSLIFGTAQSASHRIPVNLFTTMKMEQPEATADNNDGSYA